jgi:type I restriction enzyme S subunit
VKKLWCSAPLAECIDPIRIPIKIPRKQFQDSGLYPIVSQEKGIINGYWSDDSALINLESPVVVFGDHTQAIKYIDFDFIAGADGVKVLLPKHFLHPKFLFYFLVANPIDAQGYARHFRLLKQLNITFPKSLPEQQRIVAILDEAFAAIEIATANVEKNLANARELFESNLDAVFAQTNLSWERRPLQELTTKIGSGATPKGGADSYKEEGISLIRSLNVHDRSFRSQNLAFIDDDQARKLSNVIVEENDVLFNITGASIARCCVVPVEFLPARVNQHVSILRSKNNELSSRFLCYLMTSSTYKEMLLGIGDEGGSTRQAITKAQLQSIAIKIPNNLEEQNHLVTTLDRKLMECNCLEAVYKKKLSLLANLKQSILHRAFTGDLTADPKVADPILTEAEL